MTEIMVCSECKKLFLTSTPNYFNNKKYCNKCFKRKDKKMKCPICERAHRGNMPNYLCQCVCHFVVPNILVDNEKYKRMER
jgi:hypothetical protein